MGIDARDGDRDLRAEHDPQEGPELVLRHTLELDRVVVARALCTVRAVHRRQLEHRGKHLRFMLERPAGDFEQDVVDLRALATGFEMHIDGRAGLRVTRYPGSRTHYLSLGTWSTPHW